MDTLERRELLASNVSVVLNGLGEYVPVDPALTNVLGAELAYLDQSYKDWSSGKLGSAIAQAEDFEIPFSVPNYDVLNFIDGNIVVDAVAVGGNSQALADQMIALGAQVTGSYGSMVSALVPLEILDQLPGLSQLAFARPSYVPLGNAGVADNQAVMSMQSDIASAQFGVDGSGITVGVLSDSFNNLGGYASDITTGDLPAGVNVLQDLGSGGSDEGRGMAQLIHDVAPGADLAFHTAFLGQASFAQGIIDLAKPVGLGGAGAQVVVDDIFYFAEPFFQDGIIAQAVDTAVTTYGASYFSSAGNSARDSYEAPFRTTPVVTPAWAIPYVGAGISDWHDFDPGPGIDIYQQILVQPGQTLLLAYQWDSPFGSVSAPGSQNDLDIYLLDSTNTILITGSTSNNINGDPFEFIGVTNNGAVPAVANLAVNLFAGAAPSLTKYVNFRGGTPLEYATNSGTAVGHSVAVNSASVGAAYYLDTPAYGQTPAIQEPFSSAGGTPILFDTAGNRLAAPEFRNQPRFVATDGTDTTFFGQDSDNNFQPNFFGTSAAAPNAAAVAALMKQLDPSLTASQIYSTLESTALDMFTPGYDFDTGWGFIQADAALAAVAGVSVGGNVFQDNNGNGVQDPGEPSLSGKTVFLDSNGNGILDSGSTTIASTDVPKAIPAPPATGRTSRVTSNLVVGGLTGRVTNVTVQLSINHLWVEDLIVNLISPSGMVVQLFSAIGGGGDNFTNTILSDAAATPISSGSAPFTGTYRPLSALAAFIGEDPNGTWKLEARDTFPLDSGTLLSWSLTIAYADPSTTTDASGDYEFAGLPLSSYYGAYQPTLVIPSGYVQTVPLVPYSFMFGLGQSTSSAVFGIVVAAPVTIDAIIIDDGSAQRSAVRKIRVRFGGEINLSGILAGAFTLTQTSGSSSFTLNAPTLVSQSPTMTEIELTFSGASILNSSLADGRYRLDIDGSKILDTSGVAVDADGNGSPGGLRSVNFHRFYGDANGDAVVDASDYVVWRRAYLTGIVSPANSFFDYDGDGLFTPADLAAFNRNFARRRLP